MWMIPAPSFMPPAFSNITGFDPQLERAERTDIHEREVKKRPNQTTTVFSHPNTTHRKRACGLDGFDRIFDFLI
jgi:hypothetical protein